MTKYDKWKELLENDEKRTEWLEHYQKNDPILSEVSDFCKHLKGVSDEAKLELALIALTDWKVQYYTQNEMQAHALTRPLPDKVKMNTQTYHEDKAWEGQQK